MTKFLQKIVAPVVGWFSKAKQKAAALCTAALAMAVSALSAVFGIASQFSAVLIAAVLFLAFSSGASAQTEAHSIISAVETAFDLIVPICVSIVSFFVVIRLAKRVVS
jgi:hypothetical protein